MQPSYRVNGRVVDERGSALAQVRVEVWDRDLIFDDFVGSAETDPAGSFQIEFDERYFRELFERRPDLYLKVRLQGAELPAESLRVTLTLPNGEQRSGTGATVAWKLAPGTTTVLVETGAIPTTANFKIVGRVMYANRNGAEGLRVRAFDKDLRSEQPLGETRTDHSGGYEIAYTASRFRRAETSSADLIVRAYDAKGSVLAESPVVFNAKPIETIDLVLTGASASVVSEYEVLLGAIAPVLEGLAPSALTDDDIAFLVGETGVDRGQLVSLRAGARLGVAAADADLPTEVFYAFARLGLPTSSLADLLCRSLPRLRQALESAIEKHVVSAALLERLAAIAAALQARMAQQASEPSAEGSASFGALLDTCPTLTAGARDRLLQVLASFRGDPRTFFNELSQQPEFAGDPQAVNDLRITLQFGALSRNHLPMVVALNRLRAGTLPGPTMPLLGEVRDLARLTVEDWLQVIQTVVDGTAVGFPPDTPGANDAEKAASYAEHLFRRIEAAFPTAAAAHQLARADGQTWPFKTELATFLQDNPSFDLRTTRLDLRWISKLTEQERTRSASDARSAQEGAEPEEPTAVKELRTLQRLFHVSPRFSDINTLRQAGFSSARSVTRLTRGAFVGQHAAALGGVESAAAAYEAAAQRVGVAAHVWAQNSWDFDRALPAYIPRTPTPPAGFEKIIPNWSQLFGSPSYCACQHCRSIYSPAAYLVELLQFLKNETGAGTTDTDAPGNGLEALLRRRPDLEQIELSCANTNTTLPYVDLVNEILERVIAEAQPSPTLPQRAWPQTTWTAAELAANPEHELRSVYDSVLSQIVFPWDLPFDLSAEEAGTYLAHLGTSRSELLEAFFKPSTDTPEVLDDPSLARAHLGMSRTEWDLLGGNAYASEAQWPALWGLDAESNHIENPADPSVETATGSWDQVLRHVWLLLLRSQLTLDQLRELLDVRFINPAGDVCIAGLSDCRADALMLRFAGESGTPQPLPTARALFHRICLFVRLQRRLGWSAPELDLGLAAFGAPPITPETLRRLSHVKRSQSRLRVALPELLCWWGDLPTTRYGDTPSQFEALFLNNAVLPGTLQDSESDAGVFRDLLTSPTPAHPTETISAHMPRVTAALTASVGDVSRLLNWTPPFDSGPQPLPPDWDKLTVPNLSRLHRVLSMCRALRLTVKEFTALVELRGRDLNPLPSRDLQADPASQATPTDNLLRLLDALDKLRASPFSIADLDYLLRHRFHSPESAEADLRSTTVILEELRVGLQKTDAVATADEAPPPTEERRLTFIKQHLAHALKLEPAIAEQLVESWIRLPSGESCKDALLDTAFRRADPLLREGFEDQRQVRRDYQRQFNAVTKLRKAAAVIVGLRITMKAARHLFDSTATTCVFDLNVLPVEEQASTDSYERWARLVAACRLRDAVGPAAPDLFDLYESARGGDSASIAQRMDWQAEELTDVLTTHFGLATADLAHEAIFARVSECFRLSRRIGVSLRSPTPGSLALPAWATDTVTAPIAQSVKQAAKARSDNAQWLKLAAPLQDVLRERKRKALVSYLTGRWNWTAERLYACYLSDVDMQPCMFTSRIKQAISSVQLFVQRCLLGLEVGVDVSSSAARWWNSWMKSYRVWEANRKIFAHPENWIEPELRDDRSPFFKELENELRQGDVTPDSAEKAFLNYLEKLERVSHLEIVAQYHDAGSGRFYLFGRTASTPHVYYYRYRDQYDVWSAWEKIDLDIEGEHLIPVVWNRRLHLFWPLFKEVSQKQKAPDAGKPVSQAQKIWEIRFAWSERWTDKWSPKKVTDVPLKPEGTVRYYAPGQDLRCEHTGRIPVLEGEDLLFEPEGTFWRLPNTIDPTPHFGEAKNAGLFHFRPSIRNSSLRLQACYVYDFFEFFFPALAVRGEYSPVGKYQFAGNTAAALNSAQDEVRVWLPITELGFVRASTLSARGPDVYFELPADLVPEDCREASRIPTHARCGTYWRIATDATYQLVFEASADPTRSSIIYQDDLRILLMRHGFGYDVNWYLVRGYWVQPMYHPFVSLFIECLTGGGVDGLLHPAAGEGAPYPQLFRQSIERDIFGAEEGQLSNRSEHVLGVPAKERVDFEPRTSYELYNWELFFHIPLLIADRLSTNQQFEEAQRWFHYIFDPTDVIPKDDVAHGAWRLRPFFESETQSSIQQLLDLLNGGDPGQETAVRQWRDNPFKPHLLARLRDGAPYMKTVVMKYIDNLIAWGDALFRRDTIESINEATQLYILAASILGPRPPELPEVKRDEYTYASLEDRLDVFGNASVAIENAMVAAGPNELEAAAYQLLPSTLSFEMALKPEAWAMAEAQAAIAQARGYGMVAVGAASASMPGGEFEFGYSSNGLSIPLPPTLYFCVPVNTKLLGYWDAVADRLFKIRHCINIEGVVRQLPLFEPPIEPGLLVRAAAAGVDLSTVLAEISPARGPYRFNVLLQKAVELCGDVKSLGTALLGALEKRDAEALSLLRSSHELRLLDAVDDIKRRQVEEAQTNLKGLERARELTELRLEHYTNLEFMNPTEKQQLDLMAKAVVTQLVGQVLQLAASGARNIPNFMTGYISLGGAATASYGGENVAGALEASAWYFNNISSMMNAAATQSGILGGHQRRREEWGLQKRLAAKELKQIEQQLIAGEIRVALAEREQENHALQREQAAEIDDTMRSKFTNQELYDWTVSQLASLYFQGYQLACTVAKRAEVAYQFERGLTAAESDFVQLGYWENLKSGLLAGEKLHYDLRRLENAHLEGNTRDFELTKHVSLALLDPEQLISLKQTGTCTFELSEHLFDLDFPGQHRRRIKTVSLSIPCVVGPYTSVNATLRLEHDVTRRCAELLNGRYERLDSDEEHRFVENWSGTDPTAIAISHAQNDSGMFELTFRDERYLPFEGAGVISRWRLELAGKWTDTNGDIHGIAQFDFDTITDVILHLRYTATYGGNDLRDAARASLEERLASQPHVRLFSLRHEFPSAWQSFVNPPTTGTGDQTLTMALTKDRFPFLFRGRDIAIDGFTLFARMGPEVASSITETTLKLSLALGTHAGAVPITLTSHNGLLQGGLTAAENAPGNWTLAMWNEPTPGAHRAVSSSEVEDVCVLCFYRSE